MSRRLRIVLLCVTLGTLNAAYGDPKANELTIEIANGPFTGKYTPPPSSVICMHVKARGLLSSAFKDFAAHAPKDLAEAGVEVVDADTPGDKHANARITFGDPDAKPTVYQISNAAVKLHMTGKSGTITLEGNTTAGIKIKLTAVCLDVAQF